MHLLPLDQLSGNRHILKAAICTTPQESLVNFGASHLGNRFDVIYRMGEGYLRFQAADIVNEFRLVIRIGVRLDYLELAPRPRLEPLQQPLIWFKKTVLSAHFDAHVSDGHTTTDGKLGDGIAVEFNRFV